MRAAVSAMWGSVESSCLPRSSRLVARGRSPCSATARARLRRPAVALKGRTPVDFAESETGAREVEHLIGRIEYGVYV